jgi:hypothetical protein
VDQRVNSEAALIRSELRVEMAEKGNQDWAWGTALRAAVNGFVRRKMWARVHKEFQPVRHLKKPIAILLR